MNQNLLGIFICFKSLDYKKLLTAKIRTLSGAQGEKCDETVRNVTGIFVLNMIGCKY